MKRKLKTLGLFALAIAITSLTLNSCFASKGSRGAKTTDDRPRRENTND